MKVSGHATLQASPEEVFDALQDPGVLVRTIPGCQRLEQVGTDDYRITVTAGVASVRGSYDGTVSLSDQVRPSGFTLRAAAAGAPGTVQVTVQVRLAAADGGTRLEWDADAAVGGMVGGVGQRMLGSVAQRTAVQFFTAVDDLLAGRVPQPAPVAEGAAAPAPATVRTAPARPSEGVPVRAVLAGVGAGALSALVGVVVGYRLASGRRR